MCESLRNGTFPAIERIERTGYPYKIGDDNVLMGECHECGEKIYSEFCGDALTTESGEMFCCRECCDEFYGIMTDNEIIKAFGICYTGDEEDCLNCPLCDEDGKCMDNGDSKLLEEAGYLLNRQKAEIERLENKVFVLENDLDKAENLNEVLGNDVDIKLDHIYVLEEKLTTAKSEAIKELEERIYSYLGVGHLRPPTELCFSEITVKQMIERIAKEMTEQ